VLVAQGDYERAASRYRQALVRQERMRPSRPLDVATTLEDLASALRLSERYDGAQRALVRALALRRRYGDANRLPLARTLEGLAAVELRGGNLAQARAHLDEAFAIRQPTQSNHPDFAGTLSAYGDLHWFEGHFAEAQQSYEQALTLAQARLGPDDSQVALYLRYLGEATLRVNDVERARALFEQAHAIALRALGPHHPELAAYLTDLAWVSRVQGDFSEARTLYEEAVRIIQERLGANHPRAANPLHHLATLHQYLGDIDEAILLQKKALVLWERQLGPRHTYVAWALDWLARVLSQAHRDAEAQPFYERALAIRERASSRSDVAQTLTGLAITLIRLGHVRRAEVLIARALTLCDESTDAKDSDISSALTARAMVAERRGDWAAAR
jgi:tetratricopeptide (TPR) repeat protein